jgi:hypothetical protein
VQRDDLHFSQSRAIVAAINLLQQDAIEIFFLAAARAVEG